MVTWVLKVKSHERFMHKGSGLQSSIQTNTFLNVLFNFMNNITPRVTNSQTDTVSWDNLEQTFVQTYRPICVFALMREVFIFWYRYYSINIHAYTQACTHIPKCQVYIQHLLVRCLPESLVKLWLHIVFSTLLYWMWGQRLCVIGPIKMKKCLKHKLDINVFKIEVTFHVSHFVCLYQLKCTSKRWWSWRPGQDQSFTDCSERLQVCIFMQFKDAQKEL